ncbi:MAG TPA: hypothetical protein VM537_09295 [Anaerolineae bacterium]|nr:hypothetical protein [Anaerolineae bacterium]
MRLIVGQKVRITQTGAMAQAGDSGFIHELRGWNLDGRRKMGRWLLVWVDQTADGKPTRRVVCCTSNEVEVLR